MKILIGMSGGVDSSVAALLLKNAGHEVIGATMTIWDKTNSFKNLTGKGCFSFNQKDIDQAKSVCETLNIPHHIIDCTKQFNEIVLQNFRNEYYAGRTPNPCIVCNSKIKFNVLPQAAREKGIKFDKFATGHYAQITYNESNNMYQILRGTDANKDQSYFLYRLSQIQLSQIIMPLGNKTKSEIREIAKKASLCVSDKSDSQDFYTGPLNDILQFSPRTGNFINSSGKVLGKHQGYWNFTIGQRRGLGISAERPLYVKFINKETNEITLGFAEECQQTNLIADNWVWHIQTPTTLLRCQARIRSSQKLCDVEVSPASNNGFNVCFMSPQSAITPGQSVVLYHNEILLGGGIIC